MERGPGDQRTIIQMEADRSHGRCSRLQNNSGKKTVAEPRERLVREEAVQLLEHGHTLAQFLNEETAVEGRDTRWFVRNQLEYSRIGGVTIAIEVDAERVMLSGR